MPIRYYLLRILVVINFLATTKLIPYLKSTFSNPLTAHIFALLILGSTGKVFPEQATVLVGTYLGFLNQYYIMHIVAFVWIPLTFYGNLKHFQITDSRTLQLWKIVGISVFEVMIITSSFLAVSMSLMNILFSLPPDLSTIVFAYGAVMGIFNFFIKNRLVSIMARTA